MLIIKEAHASWLSYHLLSSSLVGINVIRTPDLGQGGRCACRRSGVTTRGRAPSSYSGAISSTSISISSKTTGLPSPSRHHHAFRCRSVAVTPLIALALTPSIACRRRAVRRRQAAAAAALPPTSCSRAAATVAAAAAALPFVGWSLRCCPPSDFVIACRHVTINALVAGCFRR